MKSFIQYISEDKIICGECFSWAFRQAVDGWEKGKKWILVHGTVTEPFKEPVNKYTHAWVDKGSKIEDWQNMKAGFGGKFSGKGYPKKVFKEIYKPEKMTLYKSMDDIAKAWKKDKTPGIHYGPWK